METSFHNAAICMSRGEKNPHFQTLSYESDCMPGRVYSRSQACCYSVFMCVHVHVGVSTFVCGMWKPESNVRLPKSLSVLFTEAGSLAEPEARRFK